jgi:hypothetical protein
MWYVLGRRDWYTGFWWGNLREGDHWGEPDVDWWIILRWIFRKWGGYGVNELSGSIKWGEFLDYLQNQLASQEGLCSME